MLKKIKYNRVLHPKILLGVVMAFGLVTGIILVLQGRIDTRNYRQQIIEAIQQQTGRQITIKGKVTVSLLPLPAIYIPGVELRDAESDTPAPSATVEMIRLKVEPLTIFSDHPNITNITLDHPVLELTRAKDHLIHWDWLNAALLKALTEFRTPGAPLSLDISQGKIIYQDNLSTQGMVVQNIYTHALSSNVLAATGSFILYGHQMQFSADTTGDKPPEPHDTPFHLTIYGEDGSTMQWQGIMNFAGDVPDIKGAYTLSLNNALTWTHAKTAQQRQVFDQFTNRRREVNTPMPMKITAGWTEHGLNISLNDVQIQGLNSAGSGTLSLAWKDWLPQVTADLQFSALDYWQWKRLAVASFQEIFESIREPTVSGNSRTDTLLPKDIRVSLHLHAAQLFMGPQIWKNATLSTDMSDASITVNQCMVEWPGDSTLSLFGLVSQSSTNGKLRFEGSMETKGKSLREMLTVLDASATGLPETGFGDFYARANIFISSEQMRLSEADVKISDLHLNGGLVSYYDESPHMEAEIKLNDINFDYFRDAWRNKQKEADPKAQDFFLKFNRGMNFNWLKNLQTIIDFKVTVDNFTLMDRKGDRASFRILTREGELGIYDMNFHYPDDSLTGGVVLNVNSDQPFINLSLNAGEIDTAYFNKTVTDSAKGKPSAAAATVNDASASPIDNEKRWSEELIDMSWMDGLSGEFDLTIGKIVHDKRVFDAVRLQGNFAKDLLTFKTCNFGYWQGQWTLTGSVYGGRVPGVSMSMTFFDGELHDMLKELAGRDNITGKVNLSGTVSTSGVNYLSWISQGEAKLSMAARGVHVQGLNLQGVTDAVAISRTASDVFNNVNLALTNGSTYLSVDGTINATGGSVRSPGITLQTDTITGVLTGEVRLVPWTMDLSTLFQFPNMGSETVPRMTVQLSGPIASPELKTDTASLEAYVSKRIISK